MLEQHSGQPVIISTLSPRVMILFFIQTLSSLTDKRLFEIVEEEDWPYIFFQDQIFRVSDVRLDRWFTF